MTNTTTQIAEALQVHNIDLMRLEAGVRKKIVRMFRKLGPKLTKSIIGRAPYEVKLIAARNKQLGILIQVANKEIEKAYAQMNQTLTKENAKIAKFEAGQAAASINSVINVELAGKALTTNQLVALAGNTLIQGAPSADWWSKQKKGLQDAFKFQMRAGVLNNETIPQLVSRVRGTRAAGFNDGIMQKSRRAAEALVRSSVIATANKARVELYKANDDVIKGMQWLSTLDARTTQICMALDGQAWYVDGRKMPGTELDFKGPPPAHWNCRSTMVPVLRSFSDLARNPDVRKKLKDAEEKLPGGFRASMDGKVSDKLNYEDWLKTKNEKFQKDVLGPTKYRLWKNGKLSFTDLVSQTHNPLTVEQIKRRTEGLLSDTLAGHKSARFVSASSYNDLWNDKTITPESILAGRTGAELKKLSGFERKLENIKTTDVIHKVDGKWTPERRAKHNEIVRKILTPEAIAAARSKSPTYVMLGGRGGSGKSWLTGPDGPVDAKKFLVMDTDEIKKLLPEYDGWNAYQVHEESSHIFDRITAIAQKLKLNVAHDMTLKTPKSALARLESFENAGYNKFDGYYMYLPRQKAAERAINRALGPTNRYVPPSVVLGMERNEATFDLLKSKFRRWGFYDNDVPRGTSPLLKAEGGL